MNRTEARVLLSTNMKYMISEHRDNQEFMELVGKGLDSGLSYLRQMPRGDARIKHIYGDVDKLVTILKADAKERGMEISCKRGCTHCCNLFIACSHEEADLLYKTAKKKGIKLSKKRLEYQARFKNDHDYFTRFGKRTKCVFLGDDGDCMVYEQRPIACRKYFVTSSPENCMPHVETKTQNVSVPNSFELEMLATAQMNLDLVEGFAKEGDNFSLSARLLERLNNDRA